MIFSELTLLIDSNHRLVITLDKIVEIVNWRRVIGQACFEIDIAVESNAQLTDVIDRLALIDDTRTSLVLARSSPTRFPR